MRRLHWLVIAALIGAVGCGGGSSSSSTGGGGGTRINNVLPITVNLGVTGNYVDGAFANVTVCTPGTSSCQTFNDILVDTGSFGLRLASDATDVSGANLGLNLPTVNAPDGNPLGECTQYQSSYTWGPVVTADVKMADEVASKLPIQVLGTAGFPAAPSACTDTGLVANNTVSDLGANGILGVGVFRHDCGTGCSQSIPTTPPYFSCPNSGCTASLVPLTDQVQNPVWLFPQDNNGLVVQLPSVPAQGAASATGTLTFGLGTQADNSLGTATVLYTDGCGDVNTTFQGTTYGSSGSSQCGSTFFDTGSNGIFFLDSTTLPSLPTCPSPDNGFYCPSSTQSFSATVQGVSPAQGVSGATAPAQWSIANADSLFSNNSFSAFSNLGGPLTGQFDFGLAFNFGRKMFLGLNGASATSSSGTVQGPFIAY